MKGKKLRVGEMKERFGNTTSFKYSELYEFFLEKEPDLNIGTFKWRVYKLKEEGIIRSLKRGMYIFEARKMYTPPNINNIIKIYKLLKKQFPYMSISLWDTSWLNEFMIHQPAKANIIVEVNRDSMNSVFEVLKLKFGDVYLDPSEDEVRKYVLSSRDRVYVVNPLLVNSPIFLHENVSVPKIEKILVDIFVEENLFIAYQGQEKTNIFEEVFYNYSVNLTTLFRYASIRRVKEKLINFMKTQTSIQKNTWRISMISNEVFTKEWIINKSNVLKLGKRKANPELIEKVTKALHLLECLVISRLDFVFKGGTSLLLINNPLRFSIDIDIVISKRIEDINTIFENVITISDVFKRYGIVERAMNHEIPKQHFKFYYDSQLSDREGYILLDILHEENHYADVIEVAIACDFIEFVEPMTTVRMPSAECILGDKLTAFAPNTTGIRYDMGKELEIIKQLFDVGNLFDLAKNISIVKETFVSIAEQELPTEI